MKLFQSYLHLGKENAARQLTLTLTKQLSINIDKPSADISFIRPQKSLISIDEIREMKKHIFEKPVLGKYKLTIIEKAHLLSLPAQNALLKILEEPPGHAIIILEAEGKTNLAPTILSRVVVRNSHKVIPGTKVQTDLEEGSLEDQLINASLVEDTNLYLGGRMEALYLKLINSLTKNSSNAKVPQITNNIKKHAWAKRLIDSNVNPKFALFNLIFSTKSQQGN